MTRRSTGLDNISVVGSGSREAYSVAFVLCGLAMCVSAYFLWRLPDSGVVAGPTVGESDDRARRWVGLRDPRFVGLIAAATVMATSLHLLTVGAPLWVVRHTDAPRGVVGLLLVINTVLVILLQVRLSKPADRWAGARRLVIAAGALMALSVLLVAAAAHVSAWVAVGLLVVAAVTAAIAEMWDSAGWWTISYEYPEPGHRPEYLAAFDVVTPAVNMAGPPLMLWVVNVGSPGWAAYAALFAVASLTVIILTGNRRDA